MNSANNNWYVFYTRSNAEKAICNELLKRKYDAYLPLVKTLRHWRNRQNKFVTKPLFLSYVFVKTSEAEIYNIVKVRGIVRCVRCGDHFSIG